MLRPGGVVVIAFSVHCWEALATSAWLQRSHGQRMALVGRWACHVSLRPCLPVRSLGGMHLRQKGTYHRVRASRSQTRSFLALA